MKKDKKVSVRIRENSWLAKLGAIKLREKSMAMTLGRTIHLYNASVQTFTNSRSWILHELKHVEQYRRYGLIKFLCKYLWYSLKYGYYNNPLEAEARAAEKDMSLLKKFEVKSKARNV